MGIRGTRWPGRRGIRWGDEFTPDGKHMANTWQGEFPWQNLTQDGYAWTAPVGSFPANGYGLFDMAGNVWQWTTDWYQEHERIKSPAARSITHAELCANRASTREVRNPNPPKGDEGRLLLVRPELLPALPPGRAHVPAGRHLDLPSRFSLHRTTNSTK